MTNVNDSLIEKLQAKMQPGEYPRERAYNKGVSDAIGVINQHTEARGDVVAMLQEAHEINNRRSCDDSILLRQVLHRIQAIIGDASTRKDEDGIADPASSPASDPHDWRNMERAKIGEVKTVLLAHEKQGEISDNELIDIFERFVMDSGWVILEQSKHDLAKALRPYLRTNKPVSVWHPMSEHPPEMEPVIAKTKHGTVGIAYVYKLDSEAPQWNFMAMGQNAMGLWDQEAVWMHLPS